MSKVLKEEKVALTPEQREALNKKNEALLEAALPIAMEEQREVRFIDFDKAHSEYKKKQVPFKIKLCNTYYEMPRTPPTSYFAVMATISSKHENKNWKEWSSSEIMDILTSALPEEAVKRIIEERVSFEFIFGEVFPKIVSMWNADGKETVEETSKNETQEEKKIGGQKSA